MRTAFVGARLASAAAAVVPYFKSPTTTVLCAATSPGGVLADTAAVATDAALEAAAAAVDLASAMTTETVVRTIYKAPFVSLAIAFLLGGLFFSTVVAVFASIIALGKENTRRLREVLGIVYRRNWSVLKFSAQVTMDVLRGKEQMNGIKNRFLAALQALKEGAAEVRRVFSESVDAIKKETQMYSAAVGLPGLIPIQYIFDRIFPSTLTAPFQQALEDALLQTAKDNAQIQKLTLKKFSMGEIAPQVQEARLFDLGARDMAFDLELSWNSELLADIELRSSSFGAKIPVTIQNLRFEGPVRLILIGLRPEEPGWEALLISLPRPPEIGFDLKVAGGLLTSVPWLRNEFAKMLDNAIAEEMLWPRRAVVSAPAPYRAKPLLRPMQLLQLMRDDPLLRRERELMASIPDDFRSTLEASLQEDIPDVNIEVNPNDRNNGNDEGGSGTGGGRVLKDGLRFWRRNNRGAAAETAAVDTLQLMAQSLQREVATTVGMPVMILEGAEKKLRKRDRILGKLLMPRSMLSYAYREGSLFEGSQLMH